MTRKGQMEMIGLVFVVVIIIVGLVLYLSFSNKAQMRPAKEIQAYSSFITAFGETEIPSCGMSASRVAAECLDPGSQSCNGDPCDALQEMMDTVLDATLKEQGARYNMSLEGTDVQRTSPDFGCESSYTASLPVGIDTGARRLMLQVCLR